MPLGEEVVNDYRFLRLSLKAHPAQFLRADLSPRGVQPNETLRSAAHGVRTTISGLVTCRQRPGSANGVVFLTLEDETAVANVIVWPRLFERVRPVILGARYVVVTGLVQKQAEAIHVVADEIEDITVLLARLVQGEAQQHLARVMQDRPELAADLDVTARGSAHAPTRRAG
jgi:error-prone DNA polymerase